MSTMRDLLRDVHSYTDSDLADASPDLLGAHQDDHDAMDHLRGKAGLDMGIKALDRAHNQRRQRRR